MWMGHPVSHISVIQPLTSVGNVIQCAELCCTGDVLRTFQFESLI